MNESQHNAAPPIDEIVARVLAEAQRRRAIAPAAARPTWDALAHSAWPAGSAPGRSAPRVVFIPRSDRRYGVADFLAFQGGAFVDACYRGLLGREPDGAGRTQWLARLLEGDAPVEIAARLRYSREGRAYGAHVSGLVPRAAWAATCRVPVAGWVLQWIAAVVTLPAATRKLRALEARRALEREEAEAAMDRAARGWPSA